MKSCKVARKTIRYNKFHHADGFRIPSSLTTVDTPGYGDTKGIVRDQEIADDSIFKDKDGIQELNMMGFLVPAP